MPKNCPSCSAELTNPMACLTCYSLFSHELRAMKTHLIAMLKEHHLVKTFAKADEAGQDETRAYFWRTIENEYPKITSDESGWLFLELYDELLGSGTIGPIMRDPSMREVRVLAHNQIFAQNMAGELKTGLAYDSPEHMKKSIQTMVDRLGLAAINGEDGKYEHFAPNQYHLAINLHPNEKQPEFLKVRSVLAK